VTNELLYEITDLDFKGYYGYIYKKEDISFLIKTLSDEYSDDIYIAALSIFMMGEDSLVETFINYYFKVLPRARFLALPMMASSDSVNVYVFMLKLLKTSEDLDEVEIVIACLADTHYPVIALIVEELIEDNEVYLNRLKGCLLRIGLKRLTHYLMLVPQIPFEAVFSELFGADKISRIKQRK
jgi:hypothetical protein